MIGFLEILAFAVWISSELWIALREKGTLDTSQDKHTKMVYALCAAAAIVLAIYTPRPQSLTIHYARSIFEFLGFLTMFLGAILRISAVLALGKYFRTTVMVQKDQKLVTGGPYKYIRHPSYAGTLITVFGLGLASDNWFTLITVVLVMFYGVRQRIVVEEEVMERNLKEYGTYKKHTKRLIPRIY